jgi:hypothetical protein
LIRDLVEYAEHEFSVSKPDKSGTSEREHLEQVERQTGHRPKALDGPDFPLLMSHVWSAFIALSNGRSMGFSGPNPLSYQEIKTWKELTETPLSAWEVEAVKRVDVVFMGMANGTS